jgi:hypothetical protein
MAANPGPLPLPDNLSAPARRAFEAAGIRSLEDVAARSKAEIKKLHGVGPMTILQLDRALKTSGLGFKA